MLINIWIYTWNIVLDVEYQSGIHCGLSIPSAEGMLNFTSHEGTELIVSPYFIRALHVVFLTPVK